MTLSVMVGIGLLVGCPAPLATASAPAVPDQVTATASHGSVSLLWRQVDRATAYKVQYQAGAAVDAAASTITVSGTQASITRLVPNSQYSFVVKASNSGGDSAASAVVSAIPLPYPVTLPAAPPSPNIGSLNSIVGGTFFNGTANVTVSSFRIMPTLVTRGMYSAIMGSDPSDTGISPASNYPVQKVSWFDTLVFCNRLSMQEGLTPVYVISGKTNPLDWGVVPTVSNSTWDSVSMNMAANGYRLPTEAEWMWAAMGGSKDSIAGDIVGGINTGGSQKGYAGSNEPAGGQTNIGSYAWHNLNSASTAHPVGNLFSNELGLYDMSGNVSQWCFDWHGAYPATAQTDPTGAASGPNRIVRGGAWDLGIAFCELDSRDSDLPYTNFPDVGFRVVRR